MDLLSTNEMVNLDVPFDGSMSVFNFNDGLMII